MKKITWNQFIGIIHSGVIFQHSYGVADPRIEDEDNTEDTVIFQVDVDGQDADITISESDNATLCYQGNTLFFNDSEGDVDEISVFEQVPFNFDDPTQAKE